MAGRKTMNPTGASSRKTTPSSQRGGRSAHSMLMMSRRSRSHASRTIENASKTIEDLSSVPTSFRRPFDGIVGVRHGAIRGHRTQTSLSNGGPVRWPRYLACGVQLHCIQRRHTVPYLPDTAFTSAVACCYCGCRAKIITIFNPHPGDGASHTHTNTQASAAGFSTLPASSSSSS